MKCLAKWIIGLLLLMLSVEISGANTDEKAKQALEKYLETTGIEDILVVEDADSPCEIKLPPSVTAGLKEREIHEALYGKVGIDLKEEVTRGNLYLKNDRYYINFKEKNIKKKIINDLQKKYNLVMKEVSLQDALKLRGLVLEKQNLKTIEDTKVLLSIEAVYLGNNPNISDYSLTKHWKKLLFISLKNNDISDLAFLRKTSAKLDSIDLSNNRVANVEILSRFGSLKGIYLSNNIIKSLKGLSNNIQEIYDLYIDGNPLTIEGLSYIERLCREEKIYRLYIDRKVFKQFQYFSEYPEYLQWVDYIYFVENNGKITEHHVEY